LACSSAVPTTRGRLSWTKSTIDVDSTYPRDSRCQSYTRHLERTNAETDDNAGFSKPPESMPHSDQKHQEDKHTFRHCRVALTIAQIRSFGSAELDCGTSISRRVSFGSTASNSPMGKTPSPGVNLWDEASLA
jgi:hypothetical protein